MRIQNAFNQALVSSRIRAADICNIANISPSHLSAWKKGDKEVSTKVLNKMLDALEQADPKALETFVISLLGREPNQRLTSNKLLADEIIKLAESIKSRSEKDKDTEEQVKAVA